VYATQQVKMPQQTVLNAMLFAAACELAAIPFYGALSDRLGRRPVYLFGAVMTAVLAFPLFMLLDTGSTPMVVLAMFLVFIFSYAVFCLKKKESHDERLGARVREST